jgi:hypothetical protein
VCVEVGLAASVCVQFLLFRSEERIGNAFIVLSCSYVWRDKRCAEMAVVQGLLHDALVRAVVRDDVAAIHALLAASAGADTKDHVRGMHGWCTREIAQGFRFSVVCCHADAPMWHGRTVDASPHSTSLLRDHGCVRRMDVLHSCTLLWVVRRHRSAR